MKPVFLFAASFLAYDIVYGNSNVTVDDSSSSITYVGDWDTASNALAYDGAHHYTEDASATATFTFTGVALYFMAPRWPYVVNTVLTIDSGSPVLVDMTDPNHSEAVGSAETVESAVLWGQTGLANTQHTVVASMANNGMYVVIDALIYTVASGSASPSTSPAPSKHSVPVTLIAAIAGSVGGLLVVVVISFLVVYFCFRPRNGRGSSPEPKSELPPAAEPMLPYATEPFPPRPQPSYFTPPVDVYTTQPATHYVDPTYAPPMTAPQAPSNYNYASDPYARTDAPPPHPPAYPQIDYADPSAMQYNNYYARPPPVVRNRGIPGGQYDRPTSAVSQGQLSNIMEGSQYTSGASNPQTPASMDGSRMLETDYQSQHPDDASLASGTRSVSSSQQLSPIAAKKKFLAEGRHTIRAEAEGGHRGPPAYGAN